jgi:hypothetical protein
MSQGFFYHICLTMEEPESVSKQDRTNNDGSGSGRAKSTDLYPQQCLKATEERVDCNSY